MTGWKPATILLAFYLLTGTDMAVAVKNEPVAAGASLLDRMQVVSLVGAAYVVGSLAVVFGALPALWDLLRVNDCLAAATGYFGTGGPLLLGLLLLAAAGAALLVGFRVLHQPRPAAFLAVFLGIVAVAQTGGGEMLLAALMLGTAAVLGYVGFRLLGPSQPAGTRAGIATVLVGVLLILLVTRWISLWIEHYVYANHLFGDSGVVGGVALTAVVGLVLLGLAIWGFLRPECEKFLARVEAQGWFTAAAYKPLQGQRVRRGTLVGLAVLAATGVWTLRNGPLRNAPETWAVNLPFTGAVILESPNDAAAAGLLKSKELDRYKDQVWVVKSGKSHLPADRAVSPQAYRDEVKRLVLESDLPNKNEVAEAVQKSDLTDILYPNPSPAAAGEADEGQRAATALVALADDLPVAALRVDQYALRDLDDKLTQKYVKITEQNYGGDKFAQGAIVSKEEFQAEKERVSPEKPPEATAPTPAVGPVAYQPLATLPALHYTIPLLLLAAAGWLAWRVINLPMFADFLIATEAELNKVSWTTRSRLIQDTIVVLVVVVLMAGYLFSMDQLWRVVLSWKPIGVLQFQEEQSEANKSAEQKPW